MTEREYIEWLMQKAKAYIAEAAKFPGVEMEIQPVTEWENAKSMISPHTLVRLCETWLEAENGSGQ